MRKALSDPVPIFLNSKIIPFAHLLLAVLHAAPIEEFLSIDAPILDVRSPAEFQRGHIPGALPFPLFSDEERAQVGTLYKEEGRDAAVIAGLGMVGPRLAQMAKEARSIAANGTVRIHCWRGGERSASVAWLLHKAGIGSVITLRGGYKSFRNHVLRYFTGFNMDLRILGGHTGAGKTEIIASCAKEGIQAIDLEQLAQHRGSAFGSLGLSAQPTTEHFENLLWMRTQALDPRKPLWLEDESRMIGGVRIPDAVHARMRSAPLLFIERPLEERMRRLLHEYGRFPKHELADSLARIARRMGPQHHKEALDALEKGDLRKVVILTLGYYDKAYERGLAERDPKTVTRIPADQAISAMMAPNITATI